MATTEGVGTQEPAQPKPEKLNQALQQQLNLDSLRTRALGLFKTVSRVLEDFDAMARANASPKWQDVLGQFSMVNLELFNIVEDIKKVSKAFVVHPKFVNAENSTILPVMLSSKLLPEMEAEDTSKKEQLLLGMQNLPIPTQIEKIKNRIDMIGAACDSAEKVIADIRKAYGLGSRQGPTVLPTLDKVQTAKIQEQENILRASVNVGEGLRISGDQRYLPSVLPAHLADVIASGDGGQNLTDASGVYPKSATPSLPPSNLNSQGPVMQASGAQIVGRSVPSPSGASSFDNTTTSPLSYANSPRQATSLMNAPSPQQQAQQQQRQKLGQLPPHQQQLLSQQQFRQSSTPGLVQVHGQHQPQYSQSLAHQQFQSRPLQPGHIQQNITQGQINQGNQLRSHMGQFPGTTNNALFNAVQTSQSSQMLSNMSAAIPSQTLLPRMQFGPTGGHTQRPHASQILSDQMFNMGGASSTSMMQMQQQQHGVQPGFGGLPANAQNLQSGLVALQNASQNPNFPQQRQPSQQ
ncbi:mediator of RNA polymerase II transcription subunit 8 isoform X2 [Nymphaea colorata]|uniref:mediator of RNA polymerase II transcription subunit 8 isoform X2 n=1 Tax=Nymphaea colorata TaxID=210225 RepID=UPI00129DB355|nr:mediator of RNA polymerase II transcription subunit 8 isoform X2 [Nymphaea colorata]